MHAHTRASRLNGVFGFPSDQLVWQEDNYKDVLPGHPVFDVVCVSTRSNRFDAQMAAGLPEQMHAAVGKGIPRRSTQLEVRLCVAATSCSGVLFSKQLFKR